MMVNYTLKKRLSDTHKGTYGHLFIIGGSPGMTGAVCLAGMAALRSGCGLVTAGVPAGLNEIMEIKMTEVITLPLPETEERTIGHEAVEAALSFAQANARAVVVGPGLSRQRETASFVKRLLPGLTVPTVVDADALNILADDVRQLKKVKVPLILTPHPGEMARLAKKDVRDIQEDREDVARDFARKHGVFLVLKGHRTVVTDGGHVHVNLTGNPGMATAGSGDVLAGMIGSFLVQDIEPFQACRLGVYLHGLAGDLAAKEGSEQSLIASDIISFLPKAFSLMRQA